MAIKKDCSVLYVPAIPNIETGIDTPAHIKLEYRDQEGRHHLFYPILSAKSLERISKLPNKEE